MQNSFGDRRGQVVSTGEGERGGRGVAARGGTWSVRVWSNRRKPSLEIYLHPAIKVNRTIAGFIHKFLIAIYYSLIFNFT